MKPLPNPCYYCGKDCRKHGRTRDHLVPRCQGGTQTVICCGKCNQLKGRLNPEEFRWVLAYRKGMLKSEVCPFVFYGEAGIHPSITALDYMEEVQL